MAGGGRADRIRRALQSQLAPLQLAVEDESHLHAGHAGAAPGGETHFRVRIVAEVFRGVGPLARHRLVYAALGDLFEHEIHALAIEARVPASGEIRP